MPRTSTKSTKPAPTKRTASKRSTSRKSPAKRNQLKATPRRSSSARRPAKRTTRRTRAQETPTWKTLSSAEGKRKAARSDKQDALDWGAVSHYIFAVLVVAVGLTLYIGHVHATQHLLVEVQRAQRENLRLHLKYNRLKGEYDLKTGPEEIRKRSRALGLIEDYHDGPDIIHD